MIGQKFRYGMADSNPLWEVKQKTGGNVYLCEVVNERIEIDGKFYDSDHAGHRREFAEGEIRQAIRAEQMLQKHFARSDAFYNALTPGQIVHYCNGGNSFLRLRAERREGRMVVVPIAMVGEWGTYDLPFRRRNGDEVFPHYPEAIRKGEPFNTPASNIHECSERPASHRSKINPASLPALPLTMPPITEEEKVTIPKWQSLGEIEKVLHMHGEKDPQRLLDLIRAIVAAPADHDKQTMTVTLTVDFSATGSDEVAFQEVLKMADKWAGPTGTRILEVN